MELKAVSWKMFPRIYMVMRVLLQVKNKKNLRKVLNLLIYFFYSFILSQEGIKYLLCTKFYSCDLHCRSGLNMKQTCPSSKMWMWEQEPKSPISPMSFLSGVPLRMLTISLHSFNLGSCLLVPDTVLSSGSCVNLRRHPFSQNPVSLGR